MNAPRLTARRLGRDTLIYAAGTLVARLASFVMLPIYTRVFTPRDYGVLQLLDMTVEITGILLSVGMSSATMRSYFRATEESERARILANGWALLITLNLCGMLALLVAAPIIARMVLSGPELVGAVRVSAVGFAMSALPVVPLVLMQAEQRSSLFFLASVGKLVVQVGLNVYFLVGLRLGIIGVLSSSVVANLALGIPVSVWMLRKTRLRLDWGAWRELARYAFPLQVGQVAMFILAFGDRYFLKSARDLSAVGIYSLGYQFGFLVSALGAASFLQAWIPQRFQLASLPREQRDAEYGRSLTYYSVFLLTVCVGVSLAAPAVLTVLATPAYQPAARLVPLLALAYVVQGWTAAMHFSIDVSGQGKYSSYANWIAAGVIIVLYALLIPPFGWWGAALATLLGFLVRFACVYYWAQRLWPVSYTWRPSLRLLALALGTMAAGLPLNKVGLGLQLLLSTSLMATFVTAVWVSVLTPETRARIRQLVADRSGIIPEVAP